MQLLLHYDMYTFTVKYIPYYITVTARTSAGYGETVGQIAFTEEGSKHIPCWLVSCQELPITSPPP